MDITIVISRAFRKAQTAMSNIGRGQFEGMAEKTAVLVLRAWGVG
jgi:hypothetical protein